MASYTLRSYRFRNITGLVSKKFEKSDIRASSYSPELALCMGRGARMIVCAILASQFDCLFDRVL